MNCSGRNWPVKPDNPPHEISTVKRLLFTGLAMLAMTASTYSADKISTRDRRRQDARLLRSQASYVHRTDHASWGDYITVTEACKRAGPCSLSLIARVTADWNRVLATCTHSGIPDYSHQNTGLIPRLPGRARFPLGRRAAPRWRGQSLPRRSRLPE